MVLSLLIGWLTIAIRNAQAQRSAIARIHSLGGVVYYDDSFKKPPLPGWLCQILGPDFYSDVISVSFHLRAEMQPDKNLDDEDLRCLEGLAHLVFLDLSDTQISDAGIAHLKALRNLRRLNLSRTEVTEEGVKKIQHSLPQCKIKYTPNGDRHAKFEGGPIICSMSGSAKSVVVSIDSIVPLTDELAVDIS
jgi:hypothetical protein